MFNVDISLKFNIVFHIVIIDLKEIKIIYLYPKRLLFI